MPQGFWRNISVKKNVLSLDVTDQNNFLLLEKRAYGTENTEISKARGYPKECQASGFSERGWQMGGMSLERKKALALRKKMRKTRKVKKDF